MKARGIATQHGGTKRRRAAEAALHGGAQQVLALPKPKKQPKPKTHGGRRAGAGRKPNIPGKPRLRHAARPRLDPRFPVHVTVRMLPDVPRLRRFELCATVRRTFVFGCRKHAFRICQFSIQGNHIHLICEASSSESLSRGIQGWKVRVARGVNAHVGRKGKVFEDRYHATVLRTPTQVRNALCYVLQNGRRHGERLDPRWGGMDPFSSAWWFDGWKDESWRAQLGPPEVRTVAEPASWLLRVGWKRAPGGLIGIDEVPPAARR